MRGSGSSQSIEPTDNLHCSLSFSHEVAFFDFLFLSLSCAPPFELGALFFFACGFASSDSSPESPSAASESLSDPDPSAFTSGGTTTDSSEPSSSSELAWAAAATTACKAGAIKPLLMSTLFLASYAAFSSWNLTLSAAVWSLYIYLERGKQKQGFCLRN